MIFILFFLIIIISIILYFFNSYLKNKENHEMFEINKSSLNFTNMYLFICCDNYAKITIKGKYNNKIIEQSGFNTLGNYFLENININDKITIEVSNTVKKCSLSISYIWNKQLYILNENGYENNAYIIDYKVNGETDWNNKISSSIEQILPWMKNWISMNKSMTLSFNVGNKQNINNLSNDMIVFLGIDEQGTVKLNNQIVYTKNQPINEIETFKIVNVNNGDNLEIDCIKSSSGGIGGLSLTYLWLGYVYAFPSNMEGFNSIINIINFSSKNTTTFNYCEYFKTIGYNSNCNNMRGSLIFNEKNWLRGCNEKCNGKCNFSLKTTISNNVKSSWIYENTIKKWYKTEKNNLVGRWKDIGINLNTYMTVSFFIKVNNSNKIFKNIFNLSNQNKNCCDVGNTIPGVWILENKLYLINYTNKTYLILTLDIPINEEFFISISFLYNIVKIYLNGKIYINKLYPDPLEVAIPTAYFYISDPWNEGGVEIKDFIIYNYVLSDNEILYYYNNINNGLNKNKVNSELISTLVIDKELPTQNILPKDLSKNLPIINKNLLIPKIKSVLNNDLPVISSDLKAYFSLQNTSLEYISKTTDSLATEITYKNIDGKTGMVCLGSVYNINSKKYITNFNIASFSLNAYFGVSISLWFYPTTLKKDNNLENIFNLYMPLSDTWIGIGFAIAINNNGIGLWAQNYVSDGFSCWGLIPSKYVNENNKWYNLIMNFNWYNQITAYLNGTLININKGIEVYQNVDALNIYEYANLFNIGSSLLIDNNFTGYISKIAIYNRNLSNEEANLIYNSG